MGVEQLNGFKKKLDKELNLFFNARIKEAKAIDKSAVQMLQLLKDFTMRGGKRIRAALICYGYKCFKSSNNKEILKAAMCIELIQSYLLIHDDIIDRDELRRGAPTMHKAYEKVYQNLRTNIPKSHLGISMAMLAGDALSCLANQLLAYSCFDEKRKLNAITALNKIIYKVIYGQILDVLSECKARVTEKDILNIHQLKTATYTVEGPLHIGALLAGASNADLTILSGYAVPLGKAFQLQDDILGLFGNEKELGKPIGSDIREGKRTLLIIKALEKANKQQREFISNCLGKNITKQDMEKIRTIVKQTGSLEYSQKLAKQFINKAKSMLSKANFRKEGKDFLIAIADYMLERQN